LRQNQYSTPIDSRAQIVVSKLDELAINRQGFGYISIARHGIGAKCLEFERLADRMLTQKGLYGGMRSEVKIDLRTFIGLNDQVLAGKRSARRLLARSYLDVLNGSGHRYDRWFGGLTGNAGRLAGSFLCYGRLRRAP